MSNISFDGAYNMTYSNIYNHSFANDYGAFAGNGKVALYASLSVPQAHRTMISQNTMFDQIGRYKNNTINIFNTNGITVKSLDYDDMTYELVHQTLDMSSATISSVFNVNSNEVSMAVINNSITPLRHLPYCILQKVEIVASSNILGGGSNLDVYHHLKSDNAIANIVFNNRVKKYSLYVDKYIKKLYELKDSIEFITNVELTYELSGDIVISYINHDDLVFAIDQIKCLKEQMVLDKSRIFKAKIPLDYDLIHYHCNILDLLKPRNIMISTKYLYVIISLIFVFFFLA